jgi:spore germination protein GerM
MNGKKLNVKKIAIVSSLVVILAVLIIVFFSDRRGDAVRHRTSSDVSAPSEPSAKPTMTITLFFQSEDDDLLHPEVREVTAGATAAKDIETAVKELVKGSSSGLVAPFPPETSVRQAFLTADGTAYVDFAKDFMENYAYGSSSEMAAVYALVDTLTYNFKSVKRVAILINGGERETLGGHLDLSRPFVPQFQLIAK